MMDNSLWRSALLRLALAVTPVLLVALPVPAAAQFSDAFNFIKAIRDNELGKAQELLNKPGNTLVDTRDPGTGEMALHIVTKRRDVNGLAFLLQKKADANVRDRELNTSLILAAGTRWTEGVRILLIVKAQTYRQNYIGETALHLAVANHDADTAKLLLDAGASPDIADSTGATARARAESDPRNAAIARLMKDVPVQKPRATQGPSL